jgi:MFS family permease
MTTIPGEIGRADRIGVLAILIIGAFAGGFIAATGLLQTVFGLIDPSTHLISLLAEVPVGSEGVDATAESIVVTAQHVSAGVAWALATAQVISAITIGIVTVSAAAVLWRVAQRRPFHRSVRIAAMVAGIAITFGGMLSQGIGGIATMAAAGELSDRIDGVFIGFAFDPLSIIVGLAILALAFIFSAGERLQRDSEGLV